ncbi:hypothetical protein SARC_15218, partial [Sphaeroforma arctica JP610]
MGEEIATCPATGKSAERNAHENAPETGGAETTSASSEIAIRKFTLQELSKCD